MADSIILPFSEEQVSYLASQLPDVLCDIRSGVVFDGEALIVPEEHVAAVTAIDVSTSVLVAHKKATLVAYAADKRWQIETRGIIVNGASIRTDEKSQNRVAGAALLATNDPDLTMIDWEAQPGLWVEVSAATMKTIGIAVGRHVQACFTALKLVQAAIEDGSITTPAQIDAAEWPT